MTCLLSAGVLSATTACHDTRRNNPLDPVATAAVVVSVGQDGRESPTITWTRYDGAVPFVQYWVLRNTARSLPSHAGAIAETMEPSVSVTTYEPRVDTLAVITDLHLTTYEDTSLVANLTYVYRVSVINANGFEVESGASAPVRGPSMQQLSFYSDRSVHPQGQTRS